MEHTTCKRCGRKLTTQKAINDGMGRICKVKSEQEKVRQMELPFEDDPREENERS